MDKKRKAYHFGLFGEIFAIIYLCLKGYCIIGRRVRNFAGEMDIIAKRGNTLVFVEVKARRRRESPADVLTSKQQERIARAASFYVAKHPRYQQSNIRFDLLLVHPFRLPEHIQAAW